MKMILIVGLLLNLAPLHVAAQWGYPYNANVWGLETGSVCATGKTQSPVDIPLNTVPMKTPLPYTKVTNIASTYFAGYGGASTGKYGLGYKVKPGNSLLVETNKYNLLQFHFHHASEHTIGAKQYALEVHYVHSRDGVPVSTGATGDLAVVGVFFDIWNGIGATPASVTAMQKLIDGLGFTTDAAINWHNAGKTKEFTLLNFSPTVFIDLIQNKNAYVTYPGSLTTPPCSETVHWHVMTEVLQVTAAQVTAIERITAARNNFRPAMALNGRVIKDGAYVPKWGYPYDTAVWGANAETCQIGKKQSPIDLPANPVPMRLPLEYTGATNIAMTNFAGYGGVSTGKYGLGYKVDPGSSLMVEGVKYNLLQFHYHHASEHTIAGKMYPLEVHYVHSKDGHVVSLGPDGDLAVVGIFFDIWDGIGVAPPSIAATQKLIDGLGFTVDALNNWSDPGQTKKFTLPNFSPTIFMDLIQNKNAYVTYPGSLTTPPCSETVHWHVMTEVLKVTAAQITQIENITGIKGNYRPAKPLQGRLIKDGSFIPQWGYPYNENVWGANADVCQFGKRQSPVDLPATPVAMKLDLQYTSAPKTALTQFTGYGGASTGKYGLGYQVQPGNTLMVDNKQYNLLQFHYHHASEHTVAGKMYPLEVHYVHSKDGHPVSLGPDGDLAVVGIFFDIWDGIGATPPSVTATQQLIDGLGFTTDAIHHWSDPGKTKTFTVANLSPTIFMDLITDKKGYVTYPGSLTTPPCSETVHWHVMTEVLQVTQAQITAIEAITASKNNYRPAMALHGRVIKDGSYAVKWGYPYNENVWGAAADVCQTGRRQSPVDLPVNSVPMSANLPYTTIPNVSSVQLTGYGGASTGKYGLGFQVPAGNSLMVNGFKYNLLQFHYHHAAEHTVGMKQYPLEVHYVHSKDGHVVSLGADGDLAVVGIFFDIWNGIGPVPPSVTATQRLLDGLGFTTDNISEWSDAGMTKKFNLAYFSPTIFMDLIQNKAAYVTYPGSLTNPPCSETVHWHVMTEVLHVTQAQINLIETITAHKDNFRPPMALNGRVIKDGYVFVPPTSIPTVAVQPTARPTIPVAPTSHPTTLSTTPVVSPTAPTTPAVAPTAPLPTTAVTEKPDKDIYKRNKYGKDTEKGFWVMVILFSTVVTCGCCYLGWKQFCVRSKYSQFKDEETAAVVLGSNAGFNTTDNHDHPIASEA